MQLFVDWFLPVLLIFGVVFLACGAISGWCDSYDVLVGITSPTEISTPFAPWLLSLGSWLVVPAIIGGAVGHAVTRHMERNIKYGQPTVFSGQGPAVSWRQSINKKPRLISRLRDLRSRPSFVTNFTAAHGEGPDAWRKSQAHWEYQVSRLAGSLEARRKGQAEVIEVAEKTCVELFLASGTCPTCPPP
ncbi:DUF6313 family protein [Streptomyces sp. NPDC006984]|uniref:DUF6313 family protein n=1 Tax=Streptomyces sp. NPDC006984 TaxID=3155463 RepID=UPI0033C1FA06